MNITLILISLLLLIEWYLVKMIIRPFLLSPVHLYLRFYIISIVITIFYYYYFDNKVNLYNFDIVKQSNFLNTIFYYLLSLVAFSTGVIIYYQFSDRNTKLMFNQSFTEALFIKVKDEIISKKLSKLAIFLTAVIIGIFLWVYGKSLFYRTMYLPEVSRLGTTLIKILSFVLAIILAFVYKKNKKLSIFLMTILMLFSIGTASRAVFLSLAVYFVILFVTGENTLRNKIIFVLNLFFSLLFLAYLMPLRGLKVHGIIPYLSYLSRLDADYINSFVFNIYYSIIFGVFVTAKTMQTAANDWYIIWVSLNPLPGKWAGWYEHINQVKLNPFAPYSLHGQIFRMGKFFTFIFFFFEGIIFANIEKYVRRYILNKKKTFAFIIVLLMVLHIIYAFEYPLRSAFRYIYYAYFIIFMERIFSVLKLPRVKSPTNKLS